MKTFVLLFAALLVGTGGGARETPEQRIELSDLAWLAGCWEGTGFGNRVSECWMSAPDGRMTGMFQIIDADGNQTMSEIFVLDEFEDGPAMRLKHFNADLTGWEGKDDFVVFPLLETTPGAARFDGLTYSRTEDDRLVVEVVVAHENESSVQRLEFQRVRD